MMKKYTVELTITQIVEVDAPSKILAKSLAWDHWRGDLQKVGGITESVIIGEESIPQVKKIRKGVGSY